jgi:hemerythrin-like domain-containing protein
MTLEEVDGYMDIVLETKPFLSKSVNCLKQDHEEFRHNTRQIVHRLGTVPPGDYSTFAEICNDLAVLLDRLERHCKKEVKLFQEAFEQEEGGEG